LFVIFYITKFHIAVWFNVCRNMLTVVLCPGFMNLQLRLCCVAFVSLTIRKFITSLQFYIHGSVHRDSILIRSNEIQQYAGIYFLQNYSACFGCLSHPSSGVHQNLTAASGTGHSIWATTFCQRGLIRRKVVALTLWPVTEAAVTVLCTPDDGCDRHPKHVE
jgi:hypothetical protein